MNRKNIIKSIIVGLSIILAQTAQAKNAVIYQCGNNRVALFANESRAQITYADKSQPVIFNGQGDYVNSFHKLKFYLHDEETLLFMDAKEYKCTLMNAQNTPAETFFDNATGMSLGGTLRDGPGMGFKKIGSLPYGSVFNINHNSGVRMNGYDWFAVSMGTSISYQWGGIMCSDKQKLDGIFEQCSDKHLK